MSTSPEILLPGISQVYTEFFLASELPHAVVRTTIRFVDGRANRAMDKSFVFLKGLKGLSDIWNSTIRDPKPKGCYVAIP